MFYQKPNSMILKNGYNNTFNCDFTNNLCWDGTYVRIKNKQGRNEIFFPLFNPGLFAFDG